MPTSALPTSEAVTQTAKKVIDTIRVGFPASYRFELTIDPLRETSLKLMQHGKVTITIYPSEKIRAEARKLHRILENYIEKPFTLAENDSPAKLGYVLSHFTPENTTSLGLIQVTTLTL